MANKSKQTELVTVENGEPVNELALIMRAIDQLGGENAESAVAVIERLTVLKRETERWNAEKEFYHQLSEFQRECPQIKKTKSTGKASREGGSFGYNYAPLDVIEKTIHDPLYARGFSYFWTGRVYAENGKLLREQICILMHKDGHKISSASTVPLEGDIGKMNDVQKFGSGETYAKRYSLLAVLGLPTTEGMDTDGVPPSEKLTLEQVEQINKAIEVSMPPDSVPRFLKYLKVEKVEDISQANFDHAMSLIARKKKEVEGV